MNFDIVALLIVRHNRRWYVRVSHGRLYAGPRKGVSTRVAVILKGRENWRLELKIVQGFFMSYWVSVGP